MTIFIGHLFGYGLPKREYKNKLYAITLDNIYNLVKRQQIEGTKIKKVRMKVFLL